MPGGIGRLHPQFLFIHGSTILNSIGKLFAPFPGIDWVIPFFLITPSNYPLITLPSVLSIL